MTGAELRAWREAMKLKRTEASGKLGCSRRAYTGWEAGQRIPRYIALACAAISFGLPPIGEWKMSKYIEDQILKMAIHTPKPVTPREALNRIRNCINALIPGNDDEPVEPENQPPNYDDLLDAYACLSKLVDDATLNQTSL